MERASSKPHIDVALTSCGHLQNLLNSYAMKTSEIAEFLGGELHGDGDIEITSVADLSSAKIGQIAFYERNDEIPSTNASCVIVSRDAASQAETRPLGRVSVIAVSQPKLSFAKVAAKLHPYEWPIGWHQTAVIPQPADPDHWIIRASFIGAHVSVGEGTRIGDSSVIHDGVKIGKNVIVGKCTVIHPNCVIYDGVEIGNDCVIHAGTVIGADGFGYVRDLSEPPAIAGGSSSQTGYIKFPQIGTVVIEDNVEIGANTCIDRGALGETRIGEGTKIDNLVQVGHNVKIGKRCVIAAQTGISGSVTIEDDCVIGGQVGFGDHVHVQSGAVIGSQAGVLPGKIVRPGVWWGTPIQPLDEYKRQNAHVKSLERLKEEIKKLKAELQLQKPAR